MIPRSRTGGWLTALRCLPLTIAWAGGESLRTLRRSNQLVACEGTASLRLCETTRTFQTHVDTYFRRYGELPLPKRAHVVLAPVSNDDNGRRGVLVIGDVHGCYDELLTLHAKAVERNDGMPFQYVILVGDLVNKGPNSTKVVRYVRSKAPDGWLTVRGNHDNGALQAALGDISRQGQKKYQWIFDESDPLSDGDVEWMGDLPYTIRIPGSMVNRDDDIVVVHAGFVPGKDIEAQSIEDMITLREVKLEKETIDSELYYGKSDKGSVGQSRPWASVWRGKEFVIFGHDAARGLQDQEYAIGLDTGACYGKMLTGLILPQGRLVHVHAEQVYCPIKTKYS